MNKTKKFQYIGSDILTRGDFGEGVRFGYELDGDGMIHVWDSTYGWFTWISIEDGINCGDWIDCKSCDL